MSAKEAIVSFCVILLILLVELVAYFIVGYPSAFVGGDLRATWAFLPFIAVTAVSVGLLLTHALASFLTKKSLYSGYLKVILGFVFVALSLISLREIHNINKAISERKHAETALPLPPHVPPDRPIVGQLSSSMQGYTPAQQPAEDKVRRAARILQISIPDRYWYHTVKDFSELSYVALVAVGKPNERSNQSLPHVVVLLKFHQALQGSLKEVLSVFFKDPRLQALYKADTLIFGEQRELEIVGQRIPVVRATYQGAQGVAGKVSRPGGDIVFLVWPPVGYDLRPSEFVWLFE